MVFPVPSSVVRTAMSKSGCCVARNRMAGSTSRFTLRPSNNIPCAPAAAEGVAAAAASIGRRSFSDSTTTRSTLGGPSNAYGAATTAGPYSNRSNSSGEADAAAAGARLARSAAAAPSGGYVSPFQDLFERMHANGPTIMGTTDEYVEFEKQYYGKKLECGMQECMLRFHTQSWGKTESAPHVMPKEHQVTVKVSTSKLPLNKQEMEILREIVGKRLNDERRELRLSSNMFGSRIENKRHVVSMLDRILVSCQRMGKTLENHEGANKNTTSGTASSSVKTDGNN